MNKKNLKKINLKYLDKDRLKNIKNTFDRLNISYDSNYPGASQFSKNLKKISNWDPSEYQLHTSNNSI